MKLLRRAVFAELLEQSVNALFALGVFLNLVGTEILAQGFRLVVNQQAELVEDFGFCAHSESVQNFVAGFRARYHEGR